MIFYALRHQTQPGSGVQTQCEADPAVVHVIPHESGQTSVFKFQGAAVVCLCKKSAADQVCALNGTGGCDVLGKEVRDVNSVSSDGMFDQCRAVNGLLILLLCQLLSSQSAALGVDLVNQPLGADEYQLVRRQRSRPDHIAHHGHTGEIFAGIDLHAGEGVRHNVPTDGQALGVQPFDCRHLRSVPLHGGGGRALIAAAAATLGGAIGGQGGFDAAVVAVLHLHDRKGVPLPCRAGDSDHISRADVHPVRQLYRPRPVGEARPALPKTVQQRLSHVGV